MLILLIAHTKVANPGFSHVMKDEIIVNVGMFAFGSRDFVQENPSDSCEIAGSCKRTRRTAKMLSESVISWFILRTRASCGILPLCCQNCTLHTAPQRH